MEKKIFIDSDGVLRDFVGACEKRYQKTFDWTHQYDVKEFLNFSDETWKAELANFKFWADMKPTTEAKPLLTIVKKYFPIENIYIITSAEQSPCAISGCAAWYQKYLPRFEDRIIYCKNKTLLANPYSILIDDFYKQCSEFSKAGGWSILFPRPWNMNKKVTHPLRMIEIEIELILKINREDSNGQERISSLSP